MDKVDPARAERVTPQWDDDMSSEVYSGGAAALGLLRQFIAKCEAGELRIGTMCTTTDDDAAVAITIEAVSGERWRAETRHRLKPIGAKLFLESIAEPKPKPKAPELPSLKRDLIFDEE